MLNTLKDQGLMSFQDTPDINIYSVNVSKVSPPPDMAKIQNSVRKK